MLLVLFLGLAFVFILLFLGGSILIQSWLYNVPADNVVIRAIATGAGVAVFYTLWSAMDAGNPGKYDSVFAAADLNIKEYDHVVSVRTTKTKEEEIPYRKNASGAKVQYFKEGEYQKTWSRSDADGMMTAILITEEGNNEPTRFEIKLVNGKLPNETIYFEKDGRRYIEAPMLGKIVTPRPGSFILRALISIVHFAILVAGLWFGMHFVFGHALGLGFGLWVFMTFGIMPMLFNLMREEKKTPSRAVTPPAKVQVLETAVG